MFGAIFQWMGIAGAVMSAASAYRQGKQAKAAAEYNAALARQNAQVVHEQTTQNVRQADREQYLRLGKIRAAAGRNGGVADEGSVLDILADTAAQGEIERQDIVYRGALAERGYTNAAALNEYEGDSAKSNSYLAAGSELIGGATSAYINRERLTRT
jgi:hypothetical protein